MNRINRKVLISLSSFGRDLAMKVGQAELAQISAKAGADGVEFRGELQRNEPGEVAMQRQVAADYGLDVVWSSPEGMWGGQGILDAAAMSRAFETAISLGASRVKMSIGAYGDTCDLDELNPWVTSKEVQLVVENDQTESAGTFLRLEHFFNATKSLNWNIPMTFDMGNWHWTGEDPVECADAFSTFVGYVHAKGVVRRPNDWIAVPLRQSQAPWRSIFRRLPDDVPRAIEYPLQGDDLLEVTRNEILHLRGV